MECAAGPRVPEYFVDIDSSSSGAQRLGNDSINDRDIVAHCAFADTFDFDGYTTPHPRRCVRRPAAI